MGEHKSGKRVFLTVGTTEFDDLVMEAVSPHVLKALKRIGYDGLLMQIGRGAFEPEKLPSSEDCPSVDFYRFKSSIKSDIENADLVISHAGAGSVLESLGAKRKLLVVVNDRLMDNHQVELAKRLERDGHLYYCRCSELRSTLPAVDSTALQRYPSGDPATFAMFLDRVMGFI